MLSVVGRRIEVGLIVSEFLSLKAYLFFTTEIIKILSRDQEKEKDIGNSSGTISYF